MVNVAVIIPIYKDKLTDYEEIALRQCFKILNEYPIIAVKPQSLSISSLGDFSQIISFSDHFFSSISGYNRLMLHSDFYDKFIPYDFILIYQLDAFVFRNDLKFWCNQGVDYIGAPWLKPVKYRNIIKAVKSKLLTYLHIRFNVKQKNSNNPTEIQFQNMVGNGGLSLRRVKKFYELCLKYAPLIDIYNNRVEHYFNEDVFWSIEVNRKKQNLIIPPYKVAINFAFENAPQRAIYLTDGKLPFGCHAWERHLEFWRPIFKKHGYNI